MIANKPPFRINTKNLNKIDEMILNCDPEFDKSKFSHNAINFI